VIENLPEAPDRKASSAFLLNASECRILLEAAETLQVQHDLAKFRLQEQNAAVSEIS